MAISFPPGLGSVVVCNYETGFIEPEMIKTRLAVVVSLRLPHRTGLCTVVPLSTTAPEHEVNYQCAVTLPREVPKWPGLRKYAKADMLATVGFARLDFPHGPRNRTTGKREWIRMSLQGSDLAAIRDCMKAALNLMP